MKTNTNDVRIHNEIDVTAIHGGILIQSTDGKDSLALTPEGALVLFKNLPDLIRLARALPVFLAQKNALEITAILRQEGLLQ